jgi:hypothetical protein
MFIADAVDKDCDSDVSTITTHHIIIICSMAVEIPRTD